MGQVNELKDFTRGQLDAVLMKIGQDAGMGTADGIRAFLSGGLVISRPSRSWREQDGVICLNVGPTDGTTGPHWIERFEKKGFLIGNYAKSVLCSSDFKPTTGVTYEVVILKGASFKDRDRITGKIRAEAERRKLQEPNAEVACLIREKFSDVELETMGLRYIVIMHEPIKDSGGDPWILDVGRGDNGRWLYAYLGSPDYRWDRVYGFAFVASLSIITTFEKAKRSGITDEDIHRLTTPKGDAISDQFIEIMVKAKVAVNSFLRCISAGEKITIDACDGSEVIADAKDTFGWIDPDFKNWGLTKKGKKTEETPVKVYEMEKDATFSQMFNSLSSDLDKLCLTQSQIKAFVKKNRKWLRKEGCGTFFLFKQGDEFFVADMLFPSGDSLYVRVDRLERSAVWPAGHRHRVVVPQ